MKALIIGSGGREQALAWKIAQSEKVSKVYIAPGNGGQLEKCSNVQISVTDFEGIADFVRSHDVKLLVVGPEIPLVEGIVDYLEAQEDLKDLHIVGPSKAGAELEGSKDFAKAFMERYHIPTARYRTFTSQTLNEGLKYLEQEEDAPYVLKADGLAAGKGVVIAEDLKTAQQEMKEMLSGKFGSAGASVVVETYLSGIECSVFVLTDGQSYKILPTAKDYKRIGEADKGLNTGGMGAVSPVLFANQEFMDKVEQRIIKPTISGLAAEKIDYKGFIFIGLMNVSGDPYVIEYNCRMGDPETEVVMPRIKSDFLPALLSLKEQKLSSVTDLEEFNKYAATVVTVSGGYPGDYQSGYEIQGLEDNTDQTYVFHMGTKWNDDGRVVTSGGRVLAVTSLGDTLEETIERVYERIYKISYEEVYYRRDIGQDLLNY